MNKVIYLEADEEIINIIDRLKDAKEKQVALVVPAGAILLSSAVNLKLLMEESKKIDKKVSIVTSDASGRGIASQIGFTVYENLGDARDVKEKDIEEQERVPEYKRKPEKRIEEVEVASSATRQRGGSEDGYTDIDKEEDIPPIDDLDGLVENEDVREEKIFVPKKIDYVKDFDIERPRKGKRKEVPKVLKSKKFWLWAVIAFVVVVFLLVFIFPKATVYLNVVASQEELSFGLNISANTTSVTKGDRTTLPAVWETKDQEVSVEYQATGQKNVGDKAKGTVTVFNKSGKTITIVSGTEFTTSDGKKFTNPSIISVAGAFVSDFGEMIPGKASGNIEAEEGGADKNIGAGRLTIPGLAETYGNLIYGQTDGLSGGSDRMAKVVSKEDIEAAKQKAKDEMNKKLEEGFGMKGEKVYVKGLAVSENVSQDVDKKENDEAEKLQVKMKNRFSFLVFSKADFDKVFEESLKLQLGGEKRLVGSGYRDSSWDVVSFDGKKKEAQISAKLTILTATNVSEEFIKSKVVTLDVKELRSYLSQYPQVELDHVSFFPPLLIMSIPSNEKNVNVVIKYTER